MTELRDWEGNDVNPGDLVIINGYSSFLNLVIYTHSTEASFHFDSVRHAQDPLKSSKTFKLKGPYWEHGDMFDIIKVRDDSPIRQRIRIS